MPKQQKMFTEQQLLHQIKLTLHRQALLYRNFCDTITEELGPEQADGLIRKAVEAYGEQIGAEARAKAGDKGLPLEPENFESDLPELAWETENVDVDGEQRVRVHFCPLADEWQDWENLQQARLYCYVDQAKMKGFNPDFEYVHIKNILDGDPYCELVVRKTAKKTELPPGEGAETVGWVYGRYSIADLKNMDLVCLRALFRERIHHTIEVNLYPILLGKKKVKPNFGREPDLIFKLLIARGISEQEPDLEWGKKYLTIAEKLREKKQVRLFEPAAVPFTDGEMAAVKKLIWERRSIREWDPDKKIPDQKIEQILEAGRAAPTGCNLDVVRFVVIKDPQEGKMVWSDIPTPMNSCVIIVVCYDTRIYQTVGFDRLVPHNQLFDCGAAADHMCLMAHALGLGAVWLTCTKKTARTFEQKYGLPEYIRQACHIAVGWPALGTIKSARMPLKDMVIGETK